MSGGWPGRRGIGVQGTVLHTKLDVLMIADFSFSSWRKREIVSIKEIDQT